MANRLTMVLRTRPELVWRLALLPVIWGLVMTGWFSLTKTLLEREMPEVYRALDLQARQFGDQLTRLQEPLAALSKDSRLNDGTDTGSSTLRQRVLYEFEYLYNQHEIYLVAPEADASWQPAGAPPLPVAVADLSQALEGHDRAAVPLTDPSRMLLVRPHASKPLLVAMTLAWERAAGAMAGMTGGNVLVHDTGKEWLEVSLAKGRQQRIAPQGATDNPPIDHVLAMVRVLRPVPGWPGWWLARDVSVAGLSNTVFLAQMGLLAAGLLASLGMFYLGQPRRARVRKIKPDLPPVTRMGGTSGHAASGRGLSVSVTPANLPDDAKSAPSDKGPTAAERQRSIDDMKQKRILQKIRQALAHDGIHGVYQPIFRASDGLPVMHEVLMRVEDPSHEDITAGEMIHLAKQHDMLPQMDAALLKHVVERYFAGQAVPQTRLALNISSSTFDRLTYMHDLMSASHERVLKQLVFEVRSHELLADRSAMRFLRELKSMGALLSVDYFGGGRSMLEGAKQLDFDYVKVAADSMWDDLNKRRELVGLAKIANSLKLNMVLEKVETMPVEIFARRIGVPYLQGYHFARPEAELTTKQLPSWREMMSNKATSAGPGTVVPSGEPSA